MAVLGEDRRVGVVVDEDRQAEPLAHQVAERHVVDRQVVRPDRDPALVVDQRRDAEADRGHVGSGRADLLDGRDEDLQRLGAVGSPPGAVDPVVDHELLVDDPSEQLGAPRVDPDDASWRHGRTIYRGR